VLILVAGRGVIMRGRDSVEGVSRDPAEPRPDFVTLLVDCGAGDLVATEALRDDVMTRYGEAHRCYHTLTHAIAVARDVTALAAASGLTDARAALLAAWLHDVIYDTHSNDNEQSSADYAINALSSLGVEFALVHRCGQLIRATATHLSTTLDEAVLCDADLAVLAAEPEIYFSYTCQIRREYAWMTPGALCAGRAAILRTLLARDTLYRTSSARGWEAAARANIAAEVRELTSIG